MSTVPSDVAIVGASLAGVNAADSLRQAGFQGRIRVIDEQNAAPYDKPPLSKHALGPDWNATRGLLREPRHYDSHGIELVLGRPVVGFDIARRALHLSDGEEIRAEAFVLAPGAKARLLPDEFLLPGVYPLRTLDDANAIREAFDARPSVVILGAGFIGLEVATAARARGLAVTVVEIAEPLRAALGETPAKAMTQIHRDAGVHFATGVTARSILGRDRAEQVVLSDGRILEADLVVLGLGVSPAVDWLRDSGLDLENGIRCDEYGRTAASGVYAAGDAAAWRDARTGAYVRTEHWTTAQQMGAAVGRTIVRPTEASQLGGVPYVWSDQAGVRLQAYGSLRGADEIILQHGGWDTQNFIALYRKGDELVGALGCNSAKAVRPYIPLIERRESWDKALQHASALAP